jgi:hypothetical protein
VQLAVLGLDDKQAIATDAKVPTAELLGDLRQRLFKALLPNVVAVQQHKVVADRLRLPKPQASGSK